jgi:hypothetical protein
MAEDVLPVMVPISDKELVPTPASRVRRLRENLVRVLRESRTVKDPERPSPPRCDVPAGFAAHVARAACALCRGWCCRNGGDDAFLDDRTLARVRHARPALDARAVVRLYVESIPPNVYHDSCIFHGKDGCTLDRTLRADICNSFYCRHLGAYLRATEPPSPTVIIAGEGDKMRTSQILVP